MKTTLASVLLLSVIASVATAAEPLSNADYVKLLKTEGMTELPSPRQGIAPGYVYRMTKSVGGGKGSEMICQSLFANPQSVKSLWLVKASSVAVDGNAALMVGLVGAVGKLTEAGVNAKAEWSKQTQAVFTGLQKVEIPVEHRLGTGSLAVSPGCLGAIKSLISSGKAARKDFIVVARSLEVGQFSVIKKGTTKAGGGVNASFSSLVKVGASGQRASVTEEKISYDDSSKPLAIAIHPVRLVDYAINTEVSSAAEVGGELVVEQLGEDAAEAVTSLSLDE